MIKIIIRVLATAVALLVFSHIAGSGISVDNFYSAVVVAIMWGVISVTIRPILGLLTLPINLLTFGLFSFLVNALLFWLLSTFIAGFHVAGFLPALVGSVVLMLVSYLMHAVLYN